MRPPLVSPLPHGGHGPSGRQTSNRQHGWVFSSPVCVPLGRTGALRGALEAPARPSVRLGPRAWPGVQGPPQPPTCVTRTDGERLVLSLTTCCSLCPRQSSPEPHLSRASRGLNEAFRPGPAALAAAGRWWHLVGHDALAVLRHAASRERPFPPAHRSPSASPLPPAPGSRPLPHPWSEPRRTRRFADHWHVDPPAIARTPCSPHSGQPQPAHSAVVQVALRHAHGGEPFAPLF